MYIADIVFKKLSMYIADIGIITSIISLIILKSHLNTHLISYK